MKKIFMFMLISVLSLFLVCCNEAQSPQNDAEIPDITDDKDNSDKITENEEKSENTPEIIDYSHALFASPTGSGDGSKDNPASIRGAINRLSSSQNEVYLLFSNHLPQ